jgi:hypothetical protein
MQYKEQLDKVKEDVVNMGFDTAMYYTYPEIDNKTFQRLREAYVTAKERLNHYIEKHSTKETQ